MKMPLAAALFAASCACLPLSAEAAAGDNKIRLKPDVKVTMTGKTSGALKAADGVGGTFDCSCAVATGGSCSLISHDNALDCVKGKGDTCTGQCQMKTKIRGSKSRLMY